MAGRLSAEKFEKDREEFEEQLYYEEQEAEERALEELDEWYEEYYHHDYDPIEDERGY